MIGEHAVESWSERAADRVGPVRAIAIYLPQFHPIPENDEWWGKGFTEWRNVVRAGPLFDWHYQPQLPSDLGFYDLRSPDVREQQAELAREHGIFGFCYYHYWFSGRRLLERPFEEILASGRPDFPFCLCWANENWTRAWDGEDREVLMPQRYSLADDRCHMRWLARALADPRYIRIAGKPLLLVYRTSSMPHPQRTAEVWREEAHRLGVGEILLGAFESIPECKRDPHTIGFDVNVEFQPDWSGLGERLSLRRRHRWLRWLRPKLRNYDSHRVFSYPETIRKSLARPPVSYVRYPCVMPGWDNSPRRRTDAIILKGSSPALYEDWLRRVAGSAAQRPGDEKVVFINAWNEWAEGNHLEPCQKWGTAYLEATRRALQPETTIPRFDGAATTNQADHQFAEPPIA